MESNESMHGTRKVIEINFHGQGQLTQSLYFEFDSEVEAQSSQSESSAEENEEDFVQTSIWDKGTGLLNERILRKGARSEITIAHDAVTSKPYAIKWIENEEFLQKELEILRKLNHVNVIHLIDVFQRPKRSGLAFEFFSQGTLQDLLTERGKLSEEACRPLFAGAVSGVEYIHRLNIIHRDLKPENTLLTPNGSVKLIDFGLSEVVSADGLTTGTMGTPAFLSPECVNGCGKRYSGKAADIWALGMTLFYLLTGKLYYDGLNKYDIMEAIKENPIDLERCEPVQHVSKYAKEALISMLAWNPEKRSSARKVLMLQWVVQGEEESKS